MQLLQEQRDYVLLSAAGLIGTTQPGFPANSTRGVTYPLADNAILTATEVALVKTATDAYNAKKLKLWLLLKD
jgi:hypothetical protein